MIASQGDISLSSSASDKKTAHVEPPTYDMESVIKTQAKSFEVGKKDFEQRMATLQAHESKRICAPRLEVEKMKAEYENKLKDLNLRIQASIALEENTRESSMQLDEVLHNRHLKEQNQRLQSLLKVVPDGNFGLMNEARTRPPKRGNESSSSIVFESSTSGIEETRFVPLSLKPTAILILSRNPKTNL